MALLTQTERAVLETGPDHPDYEQVSARVSEKLATLGEDLALVTAYAPEVVDESGFPARAEALRRVLDDGDPLVDDATAHAAFDCYD